MIGQMRAGDASQPPEERFASQLDQLASMGFADRQANIQGNYQLLILVFSLSRSSRYVPEFLHVLHI